MIPNTMFRPMTVTIMKKVKSKKIDLKAASLNFVGNAVVYIHMRIVNQTLHSNVVT